MTYVYESKNDDPNGCPDTVIGECEAICARCQRDMHDELLELRAMRDRARRLIGEGTYATTYYATIMHILGERP